MLLVVQQKHFNIRKTALIVFAFAHSPYRSGCFWLVDQRNGTGTEKTPTFTDLLSSSIFDVFWTDFDAKSTKNVYEITTKTQ